MTQKSNNTGTDIGLDAYFEAEQATNITPSDDLMAMVLRDAQSVQPMPAGLTGAPSNPTSGSSWLADIVVAFGGWKGGLTLATCLLVGVSIGYMPPDALLDFADEILTTAGVLTIDGGYSPLEDMFTEG